MMRTTAPQEPPSKDRYISERGGLRCADHLERMTRALLGHCGTRAGQRDLHGSVRGRIAALNISHWHDRLRGLLVTLNAREHQAHRPAEGPADGLAQAKHPDEL